MLMVNRKFRVANDVDGENMRDLKLDLFLDLKGHLVGDYFSALRAMGFRPFCSPHCNDKMIYPDTRTRATLTIAAVAFLCIVAADPGHRLRSFHRAIVATITGSIAGQ
jgi:hypothetical protein